MRTLQPTSLQANEASKPNRNKHQLQIIAALKQLPNCSGVADDIAVFCPFDKTEVSRRMRAMCDDGIVYEAIKTGQTRKGCKAITWILSDKYRDKPQVKETKVIELRMGQLKLAL